MARHHPRLQAEPLLDVSVTSSFGSPIMFNPKRGIEASAGVLKDIILGNEVSDMSNNNSFNSNADFEELEQVLHPQQYRRQEIRRSSRSAHNMAKSSIDLRRVGSQLHRNHSSSPAGKRVSSNSTRRYSPPQGSTGSTSKSPEITPKTSWDHGVPLTTSSPILQRRLIFHRSPPYYVADTMNSSLDVPYLEHNLSNTSIGPVYHPHPNPGMHSWHHNPQDMTMSLYDDSFYRMLPPTTSTTAAAIASASEACHVLSDEELHREYAVVLDALNHSCHCLIPMTSTPQIATESPGIHTGILSNQNISAGLINHQSGIQSCSSNSGAIPASSFWQTCGGCAREAAVAAASASGLETCVDDSLCAEDLMVSSWNGLSGVPGLGVSVPSRPGLVHPSHDELEAEWSAHSAHSLASFKVDLPRVHQHSHHHNQGHPELRPTRSSAASGGWPRTSSSSNNNNNNSSSSSGGNGSGYSNNGVSAVGHLLAGSGVVQDDFQRGHSKKQPLRATIASRSSGGRPKLSEATRHSTSASAGPASLPNQFIVPRAPIPTPEVLAAKKAATKSNSGGGKISSHNSTVKCSADRVDHRTERAERATDHRTERAAERAADHRITERAKPTSSEHFPSRPETEINLESKNQIYQSPRDRDGDYSYAYDCSISPAVVIKWGESEDEDEEPIKVKNENIYEEIQEVRQDSSSGSNTDSGIGVTSKSFCTSSAGSSSMPCSKGTLDVKKKVQNQNNLHNKPPREPVKPMSSLDALLCQTTLTADQRLDLRKSLVDELFEELIQRHHKRVLEELNLDVEEFIKPSPEQLSENFRENDSLGTPKSSRSSANNTNGFTEKSGLTRCESLDFKNKQQETTTTTNTNDNNHSDEKTRENNVRLGSKLWQSARKCSEVIQRKWNRKKSSPASTSSSSSPEVDNHRSSRPEMTSMGGNFRENDFTKKSSSDVVVEDWPQVSRRGRRPLSAVVSHKHNNNVLARNSNHVIHQDLEDEADSDSEVEARRLLRSQIIKSFWEQHDLENQEQVPGGAISAEEDNVS